MALGGGGGGVDSLMNVVGEQSMKMHFQTIVGHKKRQSLFLLDGPHVLSVFI